MRRPWLLVLSAAAWVGCAQPRPDPSGALMTPAPVRTAPAPSSPKPEPVVTPQPTMTGRVASVNQQARFVVLTFPVGGLPPADRRLGAYRNGLKVGELKVTRWQIDNNAVADILSGECRVGDEVRQE